MPRGVKGSFNYEAQVQSITDRIQRYNRLIDDLNAQLEELEYKKRENEMQELYNFMEDKNLDIKDILNKLKED